MQQTSQPIQFSIDESSPFASRASKPLVVLAGVAVVVAACLAAAYVAGQFLLAFFILHAWFFFG
jgi:hypothetical protein